MAKITTIRITEDLKKEIEKLKIHPRETMQDVVKRLVFQKK